MLWTGCWNSGGRCALEGDVLCAICSKHNDHQESRPYIHFHFKRHIIPKFKLRADKCYMQHALHCKSYCWNFAVEVFSKTSSHFLLHLLSLPHYHVCIEKPSCYFPSPLLSFEDICSPFLKSLYSIPSGSSPSIPKSSLLLWSTDFTWPKIFPSNCGFSYGHSPITLRAIFESHRKWLIGTHRYYPKL